MNEAFINIVPKIILTIMFPIRYSSSWISIPTLILTLTVTLISWCNTPSTINFTTPTDSPWNANEGHLMLSWDGSDDGRGDVAQSIFQLEQDDKADFSSARTAYKGTDNSTFISGLAKGTYYFRVRGVSKIHEPLPWSDTIQINVNYVSPRLVTTLLIVGVAVLVATVVAILRGHNRFKA